MNLTQSNPYRILGLLVGATAAQQNRQITRLKHFIEAEQEPDADFSFPIIGNFNRTLENVIDAASKLNLDSDKINAALFWFYNGNSITDEPAFDFLKEGKIDEAKAIWAKLATTEVTARSASAFQNLSTLLLCIGLGDVLRFEQAISLKLKFIESDFVNDFEAIATDITYKATKKELQLLFLNQIIHELEKSTAITISQFIEIVNKQNFSAKEDFLKGFVQKPIEEIERKIEEIRKSQKANPAKAGEYGADLYKTTEPFLISITTILGKSDIKLISVSDKLANEILECSITLFNHFHDTETEVGEIALDLNKKAESIALGSVIKERISDSLSTLEEMKDKEVLLAIEFIKSVKDSFIENEREIRNQVRKLEREDLEIILGHKSINSKAVEDNIKNSINWEKVNELLLSVLTDKNLIKIKENANNELKKEFINIATWLKENSLKSSTISTIIDKYKKIPPKLTFKILNSEITNTDINNKPLPITNPLYKKHTRYIGLKLRVECSEDRNVIIYKKHINPEGNYSSNEKISPKGYSNSKTVSINTDTIEINLPGWGNNDSCTYSVGKHRIEVYVDDYMIHSKDFSVDLAPSEKLEIDFKKAEEKLIEIKNTQYFKSELESLNFQMSKIKEWHFLRSQSERERQINEHQQQIDKVVKKADNEKDSQTSKQQSLINEIKSKLQNAEY